jgi:hypothetical protein
VTEDTAIYETATGPRATLAIESLDALEPQLVAFVRSSARWLDARFPQAGRRGPNEGGGWTEDSGAAVTVMQTEELAEGRGVRIIRLLRALGDARTGAIRIIAVGLAPPAQLELRWDFDAAEDGLRGTSAELTAEGAHHEECLADFHRWFD